MYQQMCARTHTHTYKYTRTHASTHMQTLSTVRVFNVRTDIPALNVLVPKEEMFGGGAEVTHQRYVQNRQMVPAVAVTERVLVLRPVAGALRQLSAFSFGRNMALQRGLAREIHPSSFRDWERLPPLHSL